MRITRRPSARLDLIEQAEYLEQVADLQTAERFLDAAETALEQLAQSPYLGTRRHFKEGAIADVRQWPVKHFEKHLIFYRPLPDGIEVIRVLHGARDIERILKENG